MFAFGGNLFAWWKDAVALHYYITQIKIAGNVLEFKYQYANYRKFYGIPTIRRSVDWQMLGLF